MMLSFSRHPDLDTLSDLARNPAADSSSAAAVHLERCSRCRDQVRMLRELGLALAEAPMSGPSAALRARVLTARRRGDRTILPAADAPTRARATRRLLPALAAAALVLTSGTLLLTRTASELEGSATRGSLTLSPAFPRTGERVRVRYLPEAPLAHAPSLLVRSRQRTPNGGAYARGVPVRPLTVLRRGADGAFTGSFVLPDSVVYAALAVEDSSASVIDDDGGRDWEVLVARSPGVPRFEALDQRAQDLMGRNWEEGFATARRMIALYPDDIRAWLWLHAFQGWLARGDDDSVLAVHRAQLTRFSAPPAMDSSARARQLGYLAWYASSVDTAAARQWRARLLREAPDNSFAIQWRLLDAFRELDRTHDTTAALARLDVLWAQSPPDRAEQVATYGTAVAYATRDSARILRWTDRLIQSSRDRGAATRWSAERLAIVPALRAEGMRRLRAALSALAALPDEERGLEETRGEQRTRHRSLERGLLAALGQALVANGERAAGLDTLALAAAAGWDRALFRTVRLAALAAGDTSTALTMAAREAVDPRADSAVVDSLRRFAESRVGVSAWSARLAAARGELVQRVLASGHTRSLAGSGARLLDTRLQTHQLRDLTTGAVTVVAFWSRFCGPAVEDLPRLNAVASRLARDGVRVIGIVDESSPSPELNEFLYEHRVAIPTYLDAWHEASRAFNQWGTPYYYVLDAAGRIRFDVVSSADEALLRAEALREGSGSARSLSASLTNTAPPGDGHSSEQ